MSLADNIDFLRRLPKLTDIKVLGALGGLKQPKQGSGDSPLSETTGFGSNPGQLKMLSFVPESAPAKPALVVVLHGCTQTAAGYDIGAGWSALAERCGFALLMPEQTSTNNANGCFNWFNPEDTARDRGEALSIRQMVAQMARTHGVDPQRVFITGLSAGGAMTSVMLAVYPEVFAAGAIIAGLPYGIAHTMQDALSAMYRAPAHTARQLGDFVRSASAHKGVWPKVSVWHGSADRTVNPGNADAIVKQWLDLHGLPMQPMSEAPVDGYPRQVWWNADGETVIESYSITHMAHGTPIGIGGNDERYGAEGAFLIESGISSSWHIAQFFGLAAALQQPVMAAGASAAMAIADKPGIAAQIPADALLTAIAPKPRAQTERSDTSREQPGRRGIDINAVITRALTAAGLMK